jgi:tetratricopeptide (TPR) repeat protein
VLQLDPNNADALTGLAVLELNSSNDDRIRNALAHVKRAYTLNNNSAAVQLLLAEHFFYRSQYDKALSLALSAFRCASSAHARGEACFQMARAHHANADYEKAFAYYYQSVKHYPNNLMAQFGLGQMYLYKADQVRDSRFVFDARLRSVVVNTRRRRRRRWNASRKCVVQSQTSERRRKKISLMTLIQFRLVLYSADAILAVAGVYATSSDIEKRQVESRLSGFVFVRSYVCV